MTTQSGIRSILSLVVLAMVFVSGCSDLKKYQKPAEKTAVPAEKTQTIELQTTPQKRERGRLFALELDSLRGELLNRADTSKTLQAMDDLLRRLQSTYDSLDENDQFGNFYLVMMTDVLNQSAQLREAIGDRGGAGEARTKLKEIQQKLPR